MPHIKGLGLDGLKGLSPVAYHRQAIGLGLATGEFVARLFGSRAKPGGILEMDGKFKDQQEREDFRKQIAAVQQGLGIAHKTAVLENG